MSAISAGLFTHVDFPSGSTSATLSFRLCISFATTRCIRYLTRLLFAFSRRMSGSVSSLNPTTNAFGHHADRTCPSIFGVCDSRMTTPPSSVASMPGKLLGPASPASLL